MRKRCANEIAHQPDMVCNDSRAQPSPAKPTSSTRRTKEAEIGQLTPPKSIDIIIGLGGDRRCGSPRPGNIALSTVDLFTLLFRPVTWSTIVGPVLGVQSLERFLLHTDFGADFTRCSVRIAIGDVVVEVVAGAVLYKIHHAHEELHFNQVWPFYDVYYLT